MANDQRPFRQPTISLWPSTNTSRVFPGVDHAFFDDTGTRYNAEQAAAAYSAMLDWFGQHLGAAS